MEATNSTTTTKRRTRIEDGYHRAKIIGAGFAAPDRPARSVGRDFVVYVELDGGQRFEYRIRNTPNACFYSQLYDLCKAAGKIRPSDSRELLGQSIVVAVRRQSAVSVSSIELHRRLACEFRGVTPPSFFTVADTMAAAC